MRYRKYLFNSQEIDAIMDGLEMQQQAALDGVNDTSRSAQARHDFNVKSSFYMTLRNEIMRQESSRFQTVQS